MVGTTKDDGWIKVDKMVYLQSRQRHGITDLIHVTAARLGIPLEGFWFGRIMGGHKSNCRYNIFFIHLAMCKNQIYYTIDVYL